MDTAAVLLPISFQSSCLLKHQAERYRPLDTNGDHHLQNTYHLLSPQTPQEIV